ncbi:MAG: lipoyl(octanoyl) transferase LipB [Betaproteobacteria bacterium]
MSAILHAANAVTCVIGCTDYATTWRAMQTFTASRGGDTADQLWMTEHEPVYTVGLAGRTEHYPREDAGIPIIRTDRGGQITYHGPGQVVAYTLVDLRRRHWGVRDFVRRLESAVIESLALHGVKGYGRTDAPGVYVQHSGQEAKIGALGLRVRNGCTYHGLALNVDMDLTPFAAINPCGFPGLAVTQTRALGIAASVDEMSRQLAGCLERMLG